jgi:hypothetical protein
LIRLYSSLIIKFPSKEILLEPILVVADRSKPFTERKNCLRRDLRSRWRTVMFLLEELEILSAHEVQMREEMLSILENIYFFFLFVFPLRLVLGR